MNPTLSRRHVLAGLALSGIGAAVLSGCGSGDDSGAGAVTAFGTEPERPLVPTDTTEAGGGRVVSLLFVGLISYNEKSEVVNELAESIESDDNKNWTIKIKEGKKFTNGESITAQSFVDSWNYAAAAKNSQLGSYFFEIIKGYDVVSAENSTDDAMEGLKVVDDTTFTVELSQEDITFPTRLGFAAYAPMPPVAFKDMKAFGENPVGWGPFKMDGEGAWVHNQEIRLVKNEDYDGSATAKVDSLTFKIYQNLDGGYTDILAGNLDLLDEIPSSSIDNRETDLNGRSAQKEYAGIAAIAIPYYLEGWSGEAGKLRRQAISLSINREELIEQVLKKGAPANDFTSPVVEGFPGDFKNSGSLAFDPTKAKELWDKAEGMEPLADSKFEIAYNDDGGHREWVDAVCNMIKNALDIKAQGKVYATFKDLRTDANNQKLVSAVRSSWMADYPSMYNFLGAQYATTGSSNDAQYSNKDFDEKLKDGLRAKTLEEANAAFVEADEILLEDLPAIPLYYAEKTCAWSENVKDVEITWNGEIDYTRVAKA